MTEMSFGTIVLFTEDVSKLMEEVFLELEENCSRNIQKAISYTNRLVGIRAVISE